MKFCTKAKKHEAEYLLLNKFNSGQKLRTLVAKDLDPP
jgi:hypothetical protein